MIYDEQRQAKFLQLMEIAIPNINTLFPDLRVQRGSPVLRAFYFDVSDHLFTDAHCERVICLLMVYKLTTISSAAFTPSVTKSTHVHMHG